LLSKVNILYLRPFYCWSQPSAQVWPGRGDFTSRLLEAVFVCLHFDFPGRFTCRARASDRL